MKALSIKQPWASLIAHGIKDVENRTWKTHFRGKIYIHASAKGTAAEFSVSQTAELFKNEIWHPETGFKSELFEVSAIIGEVEIIDCVINHESIWAEQMKTYKCDETGINILCRNQQYIWNWVLANPILYDKPILNVKGKLSFWEPEFEKFPCLDFAHGTSRCTQQCENCKN